MIEGDLFEQELQKKKRRVLILLVCFFVLAGGGFIAQSNALVEGTIEGGTVTPVPVANVTSQPTPAATLTPATDEPEVNNTSGRPTPTSTQTQTSIPTQTPTPTVEAEVLPQLEGETATTADGVGVPIDTETETPAINATEKTVTATVASEGDAATVTAEAVIGEVNAESSDNEEGQAEADRDSGDEMTADDTGVAPTDELTGEEQLDADVGGTSSPDEANTQGKPVEQESEQETDFQPPPGQLPVTGSTILNWNIAPMVVAVSLLIVLVGAGMSSLFAKRRRY